MLAGCLTFFEGILFDFESFSISISVRANPCFVEVLVRRYTRENRSGGGGGSSLRADEC